MAKERLNITQTENSYTELIYTQNVPVNLSINEDVSKNGGYLLSHYYAVPSA